MAGDIEQLEKDMQKSARDMAGTQPALRHECATDLSELQQNEAKLRMQYSARYIRQGQGGYMVPREAPITEAMDKVAEDLKRAEKALGNGNAIRQRRMPSGRWRSSKACAPRWSAWRAATASSKRSAAERSATDGQQQNGQQGGQQQAGSKPAASRPDGQQGGGRQGGGRSQRASPAYGPRGNEFAVRERNMADSFRKACTIFPTRGRWIRSAMLNEAPRGLSEMRSQFKDNADMTRQITDVEREISRLQVGDISSQELQNRLNREILPNLEALEAPASQADRAG